MSRSVRDPDYRHRRRTHERPCNGRHCAECTDPPTRDWWTRKAQPMHDAVKGPRQ